MRAWYALMLAVLLCSCGGGDVPTPTAPSPSPSPSPGAVAPAVTHRVSGTVRDGEGRPVEGAGVFVGNPTKTPSPNFSATTDAAGTFTGTISSGSYRLRVSKPGHEEVNREVSISSDTVLSVTLPVGIRIFGKVTEIGVGPLDEVTIEVISGPSAGRRTV